MFGYVGLGPGQEFIPYFLALLAFIWAAMMAVFQWPLLVLARLVRGRKAKTAKAQVSVARALAAENSSPSPEPSVAEERRDLAAQGQDRP
jgi:hypothetical protein